VLLSQSELFQILPHAYPFLMIDEVMDIKVGESLVAVKNITANEWIFENQCFQIDHLPEPFLIEAAAQAALVLYSLSDGTRGKGIKFLGKVKAELHDLPKLGERITIHVNLVKLIKNLGFFNSSITVDERKIMGLELICGVMTDAK
jgi:3-hydroxyacyl-[acyl-carrier-protein] dehydratase